MELHSVVDALNDISYGVIEGNLTQDEIANAIDGLAVIVKTKAEKLFDTFTQVFHLDQYNVNNCCDTTSTNTSIDSTFNW